MGKPQDQNQFRTQSHSLRSGNGNAPGWLAWVAALLLWLPATTAWAAPGPIMGSVFGNLFAGNRPENLGAVAGQLRPCPNSPNCVSSQTPITDLQHTIAPLQIMGDADHVFAALTELVKATERTTVITESPNYLYAEFTTPLLGFVDDVEFLLDGETNQIQVRSASRLGESDLGLNRQRIETLRAQLTQKLALEQAAVILTPSNSTLENSTLENSTPES
ncbi:DUF1499 domain-containing protein [Limnothrix redekei]|uniref:DUF1499 domain-containing protein n=1 Tax=Limnothrix redekei LRLZ20PSL1 TaxID=3112953 RepID=A0ABW7C5P9_9CYAN